MGGQTNKKNSRHKLPKSRNLEPGAATNPVRPPHTKLRETQARVVRTGVSGARGKKFTPPSMIFGAWIQAPVEAQLRGVSLPQARRFAVWIQESIAIEKPVIPGSQKDGAVPKSSSCQVPRGWFRSSVRQLARCV